MDVVCAGQAALYWRREFIDFSASFEHVNHPILFKLRDVFIVIAGFLRGTVHRFVVSDVRSENVRVVGL